MGDELRDLAGTTYERARLRDARFSWIDLSGSRISHAGLRDVRKRGVEAVRRVLADLTDADLAGRTTPVEGAGWPPPDSYSVAEALSIVVNQDWHHRRFAERDLAVLTSD